MGKSKIRTLLMASVTIMLCAAMIVGGSYALWSDSVTVSSHLEAGTLKVGLNRMSYSKTFLDPETGYLTTKSVTDSGEGVDLTASSTTSNVFGIESGELVVPGSVYEARLKLTNAGNVAFDYKIAIELTTEANALAEQMNVFVKEGNGDFILKGTLADFKIDDGKVIIDTQTMAKDTAEKEFTVRIEFDDKGADNNAAKAQKLDFDLLVIAHQKTGE